MTHVSDIKLIRTDTTLDLSQKAEKGMLSTATMFLFYIEFLGCPFSCFFDVGQKPKPMVHSPMH